jgi:hypothetical protein
MEIKVAEEQVLYSKLLNRGMLIGLVLLAITFLIYATGIIDPMISKDDVSKYWVLPVHEYLEQSGMEAGWAWLGNINYSDMLNFVPIAFLSLLTIVCYASILPALIRNKDKAFIIIVIAEIVVLSVAASGILGSGGH